VPAGSRRRGRKGGKARRTAKEIKSARSIIQYTTTTMHYTIFYLFSYYDKCNACF
jgi:hypothetical protein